MIEEILKDLYKIDIPLPKNPLRSLNSYVIKTQGRNLIIDTGWDQKECLDAMQEGLKSLGVDSRETDFFITHFHADHIGLLPRLVAESSTVYFNRFEAEWIKLEERWNNFGDFARSNGFPEGDLQRVLQSHPGYKYGLSQGQSFHILKEGDRIDIGDYAFECIETPGHSRGHLCLYEPRKKILVAGDHILSRITPTIQSWSDQGGNPLKVYLESLNKIDRLDIELVLPGHRSIFKDCKKRIRELRNHHQERLKEILALLSRGGCNAFEMASQMKWDVNYKSWDMFPVSQKWFATGEAISHLKYLEEEKKVKMDWRGLTRVFSLA
jgi:glyoxylase-like metal-dependent hydrolase (beta-lactamase superfamily II)